MFLNLKRYITKKLIKQRLSLIFLYMLLFLLSFDCIYTSLFNLNIESKIEIKNIENNGTKLEKQIEEHNIQTLIKSENIEKVYFVYNPSNYLGNIVIYKNKTYFKLSQLPAISLNFYEKYFFENKIPYEWMKIETFINNKNLSFNNKNKKEYIFVEYKSFIPNILMFILLIFILEKSGIINIGLNNKFKLLFPEDIDGDISELVGLEEIKENVEKIRYILSNNIEHYKNFNILFSGPSGTGKTKTASYLAKTLGIPVILGTGNLETGYVAGGSNNVKSLYKSATDIANMFDKKIIIFLDEAQVLLKKRNNKNQNSSKWDDDTTNELLSNLDGVNTKKDVQIIFIAASNFDDSNMEIDEAIERRFQQKLYFRLPNIQERKKIIEINLIKNNIDINKIDLSYLSEVTTKLSPAKLEIIIKETLLNKNYDTNITTEDLLKNFEIMTIGHTTKKITENNNKEREIIILHELGHFFCYLHFLSKKYDYNKTEIINNLEILKISSESIAKYNALGFVLNIEEEKNLKSLSDLEEEIIKLYGGVASEEMFLGKENITTGSYNDIEKITKILDLIFNKLNMYNDSKINYSILDKKHNFINIEKKSSLLYENSKTLINNNKDNILKLKDILLEKWILDKHDIIDLINKNVIELKK